jgi:hypothetical protein
MTHVPLRIAPIHATALAVEAMQSASCPAIEVADKALGLPDAFAATAGNQSD